MSGEAFVQLTCPNCEKSWESNPSDLPGVGETFYCPDCQTGKPLSDFARTRTDLNTLQQLT